MPKTPQATPKVTRVGEPRYLIELTETEALALHRFLGALTGLQTRFVLGEDRDLYCALDDALGTPDYDLFDLHDLIG